MNWLTEVEAKQFVCPLMSPNPIPGYACCGARCMAWRWRDERNSNDELGTCNYLQRRLEVQEPPTRFSR